MAVRYSHQSSESITGPGAETSPRTLIDLPSYPFTEQYGTWNPSFPDFDQALEIDELTGHVYLRSAVDPDFLYSTDTYEFSTSDTPKVQEELEILTSFVKDHFHRGREAMGLSSGIGRGGGELEGWLSNKSVLEVGANNLVLAKKLAGLGAQVTAVDPLAPNGCEDERVDSFPQKVEEWLRTSTQEYDLVIARHTLEHIRSPFEILNLVRERLSDGSVLVFEVPDLSAMLLKLRFDAITHQHVHYFDERSFRVLAAATGFSVLGISRNSRGSNGGSLLVALTKGTSRFTPSPQDISNKAQQIQETFNVYRTVQDNLARAIESFSGDKWVFGASLLLATLNYGLRGALESFDGIIDDNPSMAGRGYQNLPLIISKVAQPLAYRDSLILVGSLENARAVISRISTLHPKLQLSPIFAF